MEEILEAIQNAFDTEKKVEAYFALSVDERLVLLDRLQGTRTESLGLFLNGIYPDEKDKNIRKRIRKLFFILKSAGISVAEPRMDGDPVLRRIEEERERRAYFTNYDDRQERLVVLGFEIKKNTFIFLNATIHFSTGLSDLVTMPVDRKSFDSVLKEYRSDTTEPMFFVDISPAYAVYLVEAASDLSGRFSDETKHLRSFVSTFSDAVRTPRDVYALDLPEDTHTASLDAVLHHPVFEPFRLLWQSLENDRNTYRNLSGEAILLPPRLAEEKRAEFVEGIMLRSEIRALIPFLRRLLEDYAYLLHTLGRIDCYAGLKDYLTKNPEPVDVFRYFLELSLTGGDEQKNDEKTSLIINPYE